MATDTPFFKTVFSLRGLGVLLILASVNALFWGAYPLTPGELQDFFAGKLTGTQAFLLWEIRIPRIVLALSTGAILAVSGAALQALFRNPLADPMILGVTFGAMLFAVGGIVLSYTLFSWMPALVQQTGISFMAFLGSLLFTLLVYALSTKGRHTSVATLLLAGIALGSIASAITGLFTYFSTETQLRDITFWTMGSLSQATWTMLGVFIPVCLLVLGLVFRQAKALNVLALGEEEAALMGVATQKVKKVIIIATALGVGASVAITGVIGFVGLVVPHFLRLVGGSDYRFLLPAAALAGGAFLVLADTLARTILAPAELPIGILSSLVGSPFFLWLLLKQRKHHEIF